MTKILDYTQLTALAATDALVVVDRSDTGMDATGTTKYAEMNDVHGDTTPLPYTTKYDGSSGAGVQFNGSDTLHDYDESDAWTPTVVGVTSGEASYSSQTGAYSRIGNIVVCTFRVDFTKNTISGAVRIGGLPVTVRSSAAQPGVNWAFVDEITFADTLLGQPLSNGTEIILREMVSGAAPSNITDADLHASNTMTLMGSAIYLA